MTMIEDVEERLVQTAIRVLNEALTADPEAIRALFTLRARVNQALTDHPTIQVVRDKATDPYLTVGVLGLINGLFGVGADGYGKITSTWDDDGNLISFSRTVHNHR